MVCQTGLLEDAGQQRKRYRVYLGPGHARSAKHTLGRASEMTHDRWRAVFSAGLHPLGDQTGTPFSPKIPKIAKKCPKRVYPFF